MSGIVALGALLIVSIIISVAIAYFVFIGVEGVMVNFLNVASNFWLILIITLFLIFFGAINPIVLGINVLLAIYGLILFFT